MKKFLQNHRIDANVFCIVMYIFFMLFAYDEFCFDTVTTETPLIKLGQLPLLRTEFVALLFSLTALIGAAISMFLRIKGKAYSSILSTVLGAVLLFVTFFDVDMLQILAPSMRISHVIMTLSRLSAVTVGLSGLAVGLAMPLIEWQKHAKAIFAGIIAALLLSTLAVEEKLYTLSFAIAAIILLFTGISGQFFNTDAPIGYQKPFPENTVAQSADRFLSVFALTVISLTFSGYLADTEKYGNFAYFVCIAAAIGGFALAKGIRCKLTISSAVIAIVLCCVSIAFRPFALILLTAATTGFACGCGRYNGDTQTPWDFCVIALSAFIGAIVSYYVVHDISQVMTFSANRTVYLVQSNLFIPVAIALAAKVLCCLADVLFNKKYALRQTEKNLDRD